MNLIWASIFIMAFVVAALSGRMNAFSLAIGAGAKNSIDIMIALTGTMCFWNGIAKIGEKSGLVKIFSQIFRPLIKFLFPKISKNSAAEEAVSFSVVSNLLGMGNAATPIAIRAMNELKKLSDKKNNAATEEMEMFAVVSTASLQIIPATLISLRQAFNSKSPALIAPIIWASAFISLICGTIAVKARRKKKLKN